MHGVRRSQERWVLQVSSITDGVDAYQIVANLGRAMSLAGGRDAAVGSSRTLPQVLFAGAWQSNRSCGQKLRIMPTTHQLFNHGGNG
jgi:hypothetical protein